MLGAFLFRGDDILKPVAVLSGGEKSRLSMLLLLLKPSNLLVLDEPTNHLDIASKDVLLGALSEFPGTVVFVSHDRSFIEGLATSVLEVRDGRARLFKGGYEYYLRKTAADEAAASSEVPTRVSVAAAEAPSATALERQEEKRLKSELRGLEREEGETLARLDALEDRRRAIEEEMADPRAYADGERMRALSRDHAAAVAEHELLMAAWEELGRKIAALKERLGGSGPVQPVDDPRVLACDQLAARMQRPGELAPHLEAGRQQGEPGHASPGRPRPPAARRAWISSW